MISNVEGFLDILHSRGLFWRSDSDGNLTSSFWTWLDLKDLVNPPPVPFETIPSRHLWWWRASRVVNDVNFGGGQQEVIDEFPFFSFLLADLHPHVLAIPFAFLAIAIGLQIFLWKKTGGLRIANIEIEIAPFEFVISALILGGLAFLNTWDFPIYVALVAGAYTLRRAQQRGWELGRIWDFLGLGVLLEVPRDSALPSVLFWFFFTGRWGSP